MKYIHVFAKFLFDLALVVFWIWVPMFHLGLKDSPLAVLIWIFDLVTLGVLLFYLHTRGRHRLV